MSKPWRSRDMQVCHPIFLEPDVHLPARCWGRLGLLYDLRRGKAAEHCAVCQVSHRDTLIASTAVGGQCGLCQVHLQPA